MSRWSVDADLEPHTSVYRLLTGFALDLPSAATLSELSEAQLEDLALNLTKLATRATDIRLARKAERDAARAAACKGRNGLRLVADAGQFTLDARELAAERRRKPRHVVAS